MPIDEALGCSGLAGYPETTLTVLRRQWAKWEARYASEGGIEGEHEDHDRERDLDAMAA